MARDAAQIALMEQKIATLETDLADVKKEQAQSVRLQNLALRRLQLLPRAFGQLLEVENVSPGKLTGDGQGMIFEIGGSAILTIWFWEDKFEIADAAAKMDPLVFRFGQDTDVSKQMILEIVGFVELSQRPNLFEDAGYWEPQFNSMGASASTPS